MIDPRLQRLMELEQGFEEHPGRKRGGSGTTGIGIRSASSIGNPPSGGLFPRDQAIGYDRMLREQDEYDELMGQAAPTRMRVINAGPVSMPASPLQGLQAASPFSPTQLAEGRMPHSDFMKRYGRG